MDYIAQPYISVNAADASLQLTAKPQITRSIAWQCYVWQGVAESRSLEDSNGQKYTLALLARRSCLHPGMRYIARGLNGLGSPGNEIECEQVVWTQPASLDTPLKWSSYVWRRGTVPIWWGVELKSGGVGEATIVIPSPTPYQGTRRSEFQRPHADANNMN